MRLFFSLALLLGGLGLFLLDALSHAMGVAPALSFYHRQIESFPNQQTYSRSELANATWQVWTNRLGLSNQTAYTVADLKTALAGPYLGTQQGACDRVIFEHAIARESGYNYPPRHDAAVIAFLSMLLGAFLLGGIILGTGKKE